MNMTTPTAIIVVNCINNGYYDESELISYVRFCIEGTRLPNGKTIYTTDSEVPYYRRKGPTLIAPKTSADLVSLLIKMTNIMANSGCNLSDARLIHDELTMTILLAPDEVKA